MKRKHLIVVFALAMCFIIIPLSAFADSGVTTKGVTKKAGKYTVTARQASVGDRKINITLPKRAKLKAAKKYKVTMSMSYKGKVSTKKTQTVAANSIDKNAKTFSVTAPAFGKYTVTVKFLNKKGKTIKTVKLKNVGVVADEYNIAIMNGSFGPTFFSMSLLGAEDKNHPGIGVKTETASGKPIPTIMGFSRYYTFNWNEVPANTYSNPLAKSYSQYSFDNKVNCMAAYVKDLRSLNKNSKFHFYLTDNCVTGLGKMAYLNNIPNNRFDCTFITDGTSSYAQYNAMYNQSVDPNSRYAEMVKEWNKWVSSCRKGTLPSYKKVKYARNSVSLGMDKYTYVAVRESSNISWWISRFSGTFASTDPEFLTETKNYVTEMGMNNMLNSLKEIGKADAFKKLFKLSSDMFADAQKNNKEVMILMGTRIDLEKNFEEFATFVKDFYGDKYEYYYKGHPASPTSLYPEKTAQLKRLGIHDVESAIPAELILFFNEDVYVSGMSNSTLNFSYKEGRTKAYFGARKAAALKPVSEKGVYNSELFELFFTKITSSYEDEIIALCDGDLSNSYLAEFNDTSKYDIAIYNIKSRTIKYYRLSDDGYVEVDKNGEATGTPAASAVLEAEDNSDLTIDEITEDAPVEVTEPVGDIDESSEPVEDEVILDEAA